MAGARKGRENNHGGATYEKTAGPTAVSPSKANNPADRQRHDATVTTVTQARKAQKSA